MIALVIIICFIVYMGISLVVVVMIANWANRHQRRPWLWAMLAAFAMYNIVFWDALPTALLYKYYCMTQAGFWVYKTPEQWLLEHELTSGTSNEQLSNDKIRMLKKNLSTSYQVNDQIFFSRSVTKPTHLLSIKKIEEILVDYTNKQILTKKVSLVSGRISGAPRSFADYKIWVIRGACDGSSGNVSKPDWFHTVRKFINIRRKND